MDEGGPDKLPSTLWYLAYLSWMDSSGRKVLALGIEIP